MWEDSFKDRDSGIGEGEMPNKKVKIGEILISTGLITEEQLKDALNGQRQLGGTLGENLIRLGYLSEEVLLPSLSEQTGLQHINLSRVETPPSIQRLVHLESVQSHRLLPIGFEQNRLLVGMVGPTDLSAPPPGGFHGGGHTEPAEGRGNPAPGPPRAQADRSGVDGLRSPHAGTEAALPREPRARFRLFPRRGRAIPLQRLPPARLPRVPRPARRGPDSTPHRAEHPGFPSRVRGAEAGSHPDHGAERSRQDHHPGQYRGPVQPA